MKARIDNTIVEFDNELTIEQAMEYASGIGCVYPSCEQSYYICSNVQAIHVVDCVDGYFFAAEVDFEALYYASREVELDNFCRWDHL